MSRPSVVVVGSGAGGSVAAWALATAGCQVVVLEKGRNLLPGLGGAGPVGSLFGNDDIKEGRSFENQDPVLEPRTFRTQVEAAQGMASSFVGDVNDLPTVVGGGTIHWDAKVPRLWRQDFRALSLFGPVPGAQVADWPLSYDDLEPFYTEIEARLGVQGDLAQVPATTLAQAPRSAPFPMPPNPPMYAGQLLKAGASSLGYTAYPFPMGVNSRPFDGRPRCNSCGFCSGYGCPINARGGAAVSFLHHALQAGAVLRPRCFVQRVVMASKEHAAGVAYLDEAGRAQQQDADIVVLAPSAIETARLLLLSATGDHRAGLGNRSDQVGRNLMFHFFTQAFGVFNEVVHAMRGPSTTFTIDDFVGPDTAAAAGTGLPYLKGGICEVGGSLGLFTEAGLYAALLASAGIPGGSQHKELMRTGFFRDHVSGMSMVGEDMPQAANRVDLDPSLRDVHGSRVPRITHSAHAFELAASEHYGPRMQAICAAAPGSLASGYVPVGTLAEPGPGNTIGGLAAGAASTAHILGTARMGHDPATSVTDAFGRLHEVDNVYVGDGSVFVTSGGMNPTLTIMALALRMARSIVGSSPTALPVPAGSLPNTAGVQPDVAGAIAVGVAAGALALAPRRPDRDPAS